MIHIIYYESLNALKHMGVTNKPEFCAENVLSFIQLDYGTVGLLYFYNWTY